MSEYNINPKIKPSEEIINHRIQIGEPMTYRDALHWGYVALQEKEMDETTKQQAIILLSKIWLRDIV